MTVEKGLFERLREQAGSALTQAQGLAGKGLDLAQQGASAVQERATTMLKRDEGEASTLLREIVDAHDAVAAAQGGEAAMVAATRLANAVGKARSFLD